MRYLNYYILPYIRMTVFLLALFVSGFISAQSQSKSYKGTVKDIDGNPVIGASITIKGSSNSNITNDNGEFSIDANDNDSILIQYQGYEPMLRSLKGNETTIEAILFSSSDLENITVTYTGYNNTSTAAISTVTHEQFSKRKDMNVLNGLGGLVNGLIVLSASRESMGSNPDVYIRGLKTTSSNNSPLILVDGVERNFDQLNPNEIASISVLKDAASLAIYGNRGANGVILVTTKRGEGGERKISVNSEVGLAESLRTPNFLNSYDYARLYNEAQTLDGVSSDNLKYSEDDLQGYKNVVEGLPDANPYLYPNVDFYAEFLKPVVKQQQHDLTMTGGNNTAKYFVLLGYMNQEGLYEYGNNTFDRFNFRTNVDVKLTSALEASVNMSGRLENQTTPGGIYPYEFFNLFSSTPSNAYPIFNEDGSLGGTSNYTNNPYGQMSNMGQRDESNRYFNSDLILKLDLSQLVKGLSWNAKGGIDFIDGAVSQLTASQFAVYELLDDGTYTSNGTVDEAKTDNFWYNAKDRQFTFNTSFNYDNSWGKNKISALALFYLRELSSMGVSVPYKTVGFASQLGYTYNNKYIIEGVASYTGSENFARGHRFGLFSAASVGWVISEEDFLKDNNVVSFLKLRASYGTTGLDKPTDDRFLFRENWGEVTGYAFGTGGSYRVGTDLIRSGNEDLKWETSIKTDLGIDFGFFKNTLLWTIDGFIDNRKDILVQKYATTPSMSGISLPYENAGEARSKGFDSELTFDKQLNKSWHISISGNILFTQSEIINIDETFKLDDYQYQEGNPIGQPFAYVSDGFFTEEEITRREEGNFTEEEIAMGYGVSQNGGNIRAGDIKYKDLNGDNVIDGKDTRPIGGSHVPNISGGISLYIKYKVIDLSIQFMGMGNRYIYMPSAYMNNFDGGGNATEYALDAWTPETAETAKYPRLSISNNSNNRQYSDFWFRNGAFIKLKTVELGFSLPESFLSRAGITKARLFINGYNLLCFDKVKDFDPEDTNAALYRYPFQRIGTLGINITF